MQFTVLIEFLIPGLATVLLSLFLFPSGVVPQLPASIPTGDTTTALLLLAVSYPVGHLVNFPFFLAVQQYLLMPWVRQRTVKAYLATGIDLAKLASRQLGIHVGSGTQRELRQLFNYMQALIICRNIEHFNAQDLFYKSLQRLARGMLFPLLLAVVLAIQKGSTLILVLSLLALVVFLFLLAYFLRVEEDEIALFFVALTACDDTGRGATNAPPDSRPRRLHGEALQR